MCRQHFGSVGETYANIPPTVLIELYSSNFCIPENFKFFSLGVIRNARDIDGLQARWFTLHILDQPMTTAKFYETAGSVHRKLARPLVL